MFFSIAWLLLPALALAQSEPNLLITSAPASVLYDSPAQVKFISLVQEAPSECDFSYSLTPAGNQKTGHDLTLPTYTQNLEASPKVLAFVPSDLDKKGSPQLDLGIIYYVLSCRDSESPTPLFSQELPMRIEAAKIPEIITPHVTAENTMPVISWNPVAGVPAYHIIVSDQVVNIEETTNVLQDASIIWQAITDKNSIVYGSRDPSGYFPQIRPPPLSTGLTYTLIVLNNYDGYSLMGTSEKAFAFTYFSVDVQDTSFLLHPRNLFPASGDTLASATHPSITFSWTDSTAEANTYKLYVYSQETYRGFDSDILIPIWQTETTDTTATMHAKSTLSNRRYFYKVFAVSASGSNLVGDTTSFVYRTDAREVVFRVRTTTEYQTRTDTTGLGEVQISVQSLDGSQDVLPLITGNDGFAVREFPAGNYEFVFEKAGYINTLRTVDLSNPTHLPNDTLELLMVAHGAKLTGRIVDENALPVFNAMVVAQDNFTREYSVTSNAQGYYQLGLLPGTYRVSVSHPDFLPGPDTVILLGENQSLFAGSLVLQEITTFLSGRVINENGGILPGVSIEAADPSGRVVQTTVTDANGEFSLPLQVGDYLITALKTGFGIAQQHLTFLGSQQVTMTMKAGASIIKGRVYGLIRTSPNFTSSSPFEGSLVKLHKENGQDTLVTTTNGSGDYSFSLSGQGTFFLEASSPGKATVHSDTLIIHEPKSTLVQDIALFMYAKIKGEVEFSPSVPGNAGDAIINLVSIPEGDLRKSVFLISENSRFTYTFDNVADGEYRLLAGLPGYGLIAEPPVSVTDNIWELNHDLTLVQSNKSLLFTFTHDNSEVPGTVNLLTPYSGAFLSGDTISNAPFGSYNLSALPANSQLIPLDQVRFLLDTLGPQDTSFTFDFPFFHIPTEMEFQEGVLAATLSRVSNDISIDSAFLVFGYHQPHRTIPIPPPYPGNITVQFDPGKKGGTLYYFFIIHANGLLYTNRAPSSHFTAEIKASRELEFVQINTADSINLSRDVPASITIHAYDPSGGSLDQNVDQGGSVVWSTPSSKLEIAGEGTRSPTLTVTGSIKTRVPLVATITLQTITRADTIYVRTKSGLVNKLVLTSTAGQKTDISIEDPIKFFVTGLDTTLTPPREFVPNVSFSLHPSTAGEIAENTLIPNPNFIGPLRVLASHIGSDNIISTELGIEKDSLLRGLNIGQIIRPEDSARVLFHDSLFEIAVSDSCLASSARGLLRLKKRTISTHFTSTSASELSGDLYETTNPQGLQFSRLPLLKMGLPPSDETMPSTIGVFSDLALDWLEIHDSLVTDTTNSLGNPAKAMLMSYMDGFYYGILTDSRPLSATGFTITPNPFSPLVMAERDGNTEYGARISFRSHSNKSDRVVISLKIYNLRGELIRTLEKHKSIPKSRIEYYWNGKTDSKKWARNGRYLVMLLIKETVSRKTKKYLKHIVLFK